MTPDRREVLVVGEALIDITCRSDGSVREAAGGSAINVAVALGRRGRPVTLVTELADDDHGRNLRAWLEASHVAVSAAPIVRTPTSAATIDASGAADYEFDFAWTLPAEAFAAHPPARYGVVQYGSIAATTQPGARRVLEAARAARRETTVLFDPNVRPALVDDAKQVRRLVEDFVEAAHIVKASDEDLCWLYPRTDPLCVARSWLDRGAALVVVTAGPGGATGVTEHSTVHVDAPVVAVTDTIGAGDTFTAALVDSVVDLGLSWILDPGTLPGVLAHCCACAAVTVSRAGADPPWGHELDELPGG